MKIAITAIGVILLAATTSAAAYAEVPSWVKANAGWWAEGTLSESEFISGIEFLIKEDIITVSASGNANAASTQGNEGIPKWIKANAGWWAEGTLSDDEFVNGIEHLVNLGSIKVGHPAERPQEAEEPKASAGDSRLASLQEELDECSKITKAYKRIDCEKAVEKLIMLHDYQANAEKVNVGPIVYYWAGMSSEGNGFEISPTGQPILSIRMLAENTSNEIVALNCTSPQICAYDVWDGSKAFKYSGMDFTSGLIALNPGDSREFNMLFGPNIGYGGTEFEYDSQKEYHFRISEQFGSALLPLDLK